MTTALVVVLGILALYGGVLITLWRVQERIVFQPPADPGRYGEFEETDRLKYRSRDGVELKAHVVGPARDWRGVVLAFHGNAVIARWLIPWARELSRRLEVVVVLPEYRGYDGLEGTPTYPGSALDAQAALEAATRQFGVPASEVVIYGHSLGTAIACEVAMQVPPRVLILESPFTSARAVAERWKFFGLDLLWHRISRVHYDTVGRVSAIDVPVHVAHGGRDIVVPVRMGQEVHSAARRQGNLLLVPSAGHNDVASIAGEDYWRWFEQAVQPRPL